MQIAIINIRKGLGSLTFTTIAPLNQDFPLSP